MRRRRFLGMIGVGAAVAIRPGLLNPAEILPAATAGPITFPPVTPGFQSFIGWSVGSVVGGAFVQQEAVADPGAVRSLRIVEG